MERPLGQDLRPATKPRRSPGFDPRSLGTALAAICLVAAAGSIALRDRPFRVPVEIVVTTPEVATAVPADDPLSPPAADPAVKPDAENDPSASTGPSIIKVNPDDEPSDSGKNVVIIRDPSAIGQNLRVAHLPDKALIEESEDGPLPIRAAPSASSGAAATKSSCRCRSSRSTTRT